MRAFTERRRERMRRALIAVIAALVGQSAAAADWGFCAIELDELAKASEWAASRAREVDLAETRLGGCRANGDDCSSEASYRESTVLSLRTTFSDVERRLKNIDVFCGAGTGKAVRRRPAAR
jgi:hypothetical protein